MSINKEKFIKELIGKDKSLSSHILQSEYTSQAEALMHLLAGKNVFLSGPAGSGKSWVIQKFQELYTLFNSRHKKLYLTSTTGLSSINIGGMTIHKWSGLGVTELTYEEHKLQKPNWYQSDKLIQYASCLIIDEISMLSSRQFDYVMKRIKSIRGQNHNLQIVVCGDFTQLPPVKGIYCYDSVEWQNCNFLNLYLDRNYRASQDKHFANTLLKISTGKGYETADDINDVKAFIDDGSEIMRVVSTNAEADKINKEKQAENKGKTYKNTTLYGKEKANAKKASKVDYDYARSCFVEEELILKVGDTVMVTDNMNNMSCEIIPFKDGNEPKLPQNGTIGKFIIHNNRWAIEDEDKNIFVFSEPKTFELKKQTWKKATKKDIPQLNGKVLKEEVLASFIQYPLRLAYAITTHKSQGQTFSKVAVDLTKCWCANLGYVALSRAQSFDGLRLFEKNGEKINSLALEVNEQSIQIKKQLMQKSELVRENDLFKTIEKINKSLDENITLDDLMGKYE